ncbi:hypothetical protein BGZ94_008276 [Podila epigama]|nr:hypothetical protein BGZ94_008276 [Podila epigama]
MSATLFSCRMVSSSHAVSLALRKSPCSSVTNVISLLKYNTNNRAQLHQNYARSLNISPLQQLQQPPVLVQQHQHQQLLNNHVRRLLSKRVQIQDQRVFSLFCNNTPAQSLQRPAQVIRGFSSHAWRRQFVASRLGLQSHMRSNIQHPPNFRSVPSRRPFPSLFKWLAISSAIITIPAMFLFGPGALIVVLFPLGIVTMLGTGLVFAGTIFFIGLPLALIAGGISLSVIGLPAATVYKDLDNIITRSHQDDYLTAISVLGTEWTVEPARPDEFFHCGSSMASRIFKDGKTPDKMHIRMTVFDPTEKSIRKTRTFDQLSFGKDKDDNMGAERDVATAKSERQHHREVEMRNNSSFGLDNLEIRRKGDKVEITLEDDFEKMMKRPMLQKYVALGKVVDRAASEVEQMQGMQLGNQVVLVRKKPDSIWTRMSFYGDLVPQIPFDRNWIQQHG